MQVSFLKIETLCIMAEAGSRRDYRIRNDFMGVSQSRLERVWGKMEKRGRWLKLGGACEDGEELNREVATMAMAITSSRNSKTCRW